MYATSYVYIYIYMQLRHHVMSFTRTRSQRTKRNTRRNETAGQNETVELLLAFLFQETRVSKMFIV